MEPISNNRDLSLVNSAYGSENEGVTSSPPGSTNAGKSDDRVLEERPGNPVAAQLEDQEDRDRRLNELVQALGPVLNEATERPAASSAEGGGLASPLPGSSRGSEARASDLEPFSRASTVAPHVMIHGTADYHHQVNDALSTIMQAPSGKKMIDDFKKSFKKGNTVTIRDGRDPATFADINRKLQEGKRYQDLSYIEKRKKAEDLAQKKNLFGGFSRKGEGASAEVIWPPNKALDLNEEGRPRGLKDDPAESHLALAHELVHARRIVKGTSTMGEGDRYDPSTSAGKEELRAVGIGSSGNRKRVSENSIRKELGFPLRSSYKRITPPASPASSPIKFAPLSRPNQSSRSSTPDSDS